MNRRFLFVSAFVALALAAIGLAGADRPLAEWVHASAFVHARAFEIGMNALDAVTAMHISIWLLGAVVTAIGLIGLVARRNDRWPRILVVAGLVELACIVAMIQLKNAFGRMRPFQVFESGDWSHVWFAGGNSFPSGHSAFYFGLFLPLAAACPKAWQRALLIAIPLFVVLGRIDVEAHFLSDVSTSAFMAALFSLIASWLSARWLPANARTDFAPIFPTRP